jgi:phosphopantetheinyl transferase
MIDQSELHHLKDSLHRLIGKEIDSIDETSLLLSKSRVSIRGICTQHINIDDEQLQTALSIEEIEKLGEYNTQTRKKRYFAGRMLAKRCLRDVYSDDSIVFSNITISNDIQGRPFVISENSRIDMPSFLSISHKDEYVLAACSRTSTIGLDFEKLTDHPGLKKRILRFHSEDDIKRVFEIASELDQDLDQSVRYSIIWSALEAAFKAYTNIRAISPIDYRLVIDEDMLFVAHRGSEYDIRKHIFYTPAKEYILSLVV